jgi:hypothetical protein
MPEVIKTDEELYTPFTGEAGIPDQIEDWDMRNRGIGIPAARYSWVSLDNNAGYIQDGDMTMVKAMHEGAYGNSTMAYYSYDPSSSPTFTAADSGDGYSYDSIAIEQVGRVSYSSDEKARLTERFGYNCSSVSKGEYTDVEIFLEHVFESCYQSNIEALIEQVQMAQSTIRYLFKQVDVEPFRLGEEVSAMYGASESPQLLRPSTMSSTDTSSEEY